MAIVNSKGDVISYVKKPSVRELGATGRSFSARFQQTLATDEYLSTLVYPADIPIYEKMQRSDAQVKAILLMLSLPIRATQWFVRPKDKSPEAQKIADFIETSLFGGFGEGLQLGFDDFIRNVCNMFTFGHSIFEKVFEVYKGQIKWKKFAIRPQSTIYDIYYDRNGDCRGIDQYMIHENWQTQYIPIEKLLIFSHDMQQGDIRGTSVLRSAYKHWSIKDFLYKIVNIGVERNLVGTPVLTLPENYTQDDIDLADEIVTTLRSSEFGGVRMPDGFLLEMFEGKRTLIDVLPYIQYQDQLISMSILAQFMNLGASGTSGSFALSSDLSNLFLMMLDSSAKNIANIINVHAIPELVKYNFNSDLYPTLSFKPMNSTKLITTLKTLVDGKLVLPDDDLEVYIRDMLDLPDQNPAQSREEAVEQFNTNQQIANEAKMVKDNKLSSENTKSKTPIDNKSKKKQYSDKVKQDNIDKSNKKMSDSFISFNDFQIDFENLDVNYKSNIISLFEKQLHDLSVKAASTDIKNLCSIKVRYKKELSDIIKQIGTIELKLDEKSYNFMMKSNIISNAISENVKNSFLFAYGLDTSVDIKMLSESIYKSL